MEWGGDAIQPLPMRPSWATPSLFCFIRADFSKIRGPLFSSPWNPFCMDLFIISLILCVAFYFFFFFNTCSVALFFFLKSEIMIQFFQFSPNREKRRTRPSNTVAISGLRHSWDLDPQVGFITSRRRFIINGAAMRFFLFSRNWKRFIFLHQTTCVVDQGGLIKKNNGTENNSNTLIAC